MISYAQNFEDVMLWRSLHQVKQGCYIDVGAQDPVVDSVSMLFYENGWRGIHVEPTPAYAAALRAARPDELVIQGVVAERHGLVPFFEIQGTGISTGDETIALRHQAHGFGSHRIEVPSLPLSEILDRAPSEDVHWLKIDVEGMEAQVLKSWAPSTVRPWIVLVEATRPLSQEVAYQEWEPTILGMGYRYAYFDGLNRFYVSDRHLDLLRHFESPPNVFDGIVLSGGANNLLSSKVNEALARSKTRAQGLERERAVLIGQLDALRETEAELLRVRESEAQLRESTVDAQHRLEAVLTHLAQVGDAIAQLDAARAQNVRLLEEIVEQRERHDQALVSKVVENEATLAAMELAHVEVLRLRDKQSAAALEARERAHREAMAQIDASLVRTRSEAQAASQDHALALAALRIAADKDHRELQEQSDRVADLSKAGVELSAALQAARARVQALEGEVQWVLDSRDAWRRHAERLVRGVDELRRHPVGLWAIRWAGSKLALARAAPEPADRNASEVPSRSGGAQAPASAPPVNPPATRTDPSSNAPAPMPMPHPIPSATMPSGTVGSAAELFSLSDSGFVQAAYSTFLRRPVDPDGLSFYMDSLRRGTPRIEVLRQLKVSHEAVLCNVSIPGLDIALLKARRRLRMRRFLAWLRHPFRVVGVEPSTPLGRLLELNNGEFVSGMFLALLNRAVDDAGYAYYLQRLQQGSPKWQLLREVASSAEAAGRTLEGLDQLVRLQRMGAWPLVGKRYRRQRGYEGLSTAEARLRSVEQQLLLSLRPAPAILRQLEVTAPSGVDAAAETPVAAPLAVSALRLGADYGIDEPTWLSYLAKIIDARLIRPLRVAGTPPPAATAWMWIFDSGASPERLLLTANSLETLCSVSEYPVRAGIWRPARQGHDRKGQSKQTDIPVVTTIAELLSSMSADDYAFFLAPGDEVRPELHMALKYFGSFGPHMTVVDMQFRDADRIHPVLLHGFDTVHARAIDFCHSRFGVGAAQMRKAGAGEGISNPRELMLFVLESLPEESVRGIHIPVPLLSIDISSLDIEGLKKASIKASVVIGGRRGPQAQRTSEPTVSVIICTKDGTHLLHQLFWRLLREPAVRDIVVVSNNSANAYSLALLDDLCRVERVQVLRYARPFNFSAQCNLGARHAGGEHFLFLNDDICPVSDDWLDVLLTTMRQVPGHRAIVGPMLLYPDQTVQHAGMFLGFNNVAGHALRHARLPDPGTSLLLVAPRQVSCLTGAALLVTREVFSDLNGFDPLLATYLQDVDLSLRALHSGVTLLFDPRSILFHMESVSIKPELGGRYLGGARQKEYDYFAHRWGDVVRAGDEWFSPLLDPSDEAMRTLRI